MRYGFFTLLILCLGQFALQGQPVILVSKFNPKGTYQNWLRHFEQGVRLVNVFALPKDSVNYYLAKGNGILITGGEDISPGRYGKAADRPRCGDIDTRRDSLEMQMVTYAIQKRLPLLGICRGEQLTNVTPLT